MVLEGMAAPTPPPPLMPAIATAFQLNLSTTPRAMPTAWLAMLPTAQPMAASTTVPAIFAGRLGSAGGRRGV
jgi:hypothetical protein